MNIKPLTKEQQCFAEENHHLVYAFLNSKRLPESLYYDVVIFAYLCAVQEYCETPDLHRYKFSSLAWKKMQSAVADYQRYLQCQRRAIPVISLDELISNQEELRWEETISRTCKIYPFTVDPCESERRLKWFICTEQEHHFGEGIVTARDWQRRNVSKEEEEFLYEECRMLSKIGKLLENVPEENQKKAAELSLALRYIAYDFDQPFLPQFKNNMDFLQAHLRQLQKR